MKLSLQAGFTIVELVVVIAIIAILSGVSVVTYQTLRADARDGTRSSNAAIISEALEKFYEKNGAYPSVVSIVNSQPANTGAAIAAKLGIPEDSLLMPKMPSSTTNGIASGTTPTSNYLMYQGASASDNASCQGSSVGGCERYTLRYREEASGTTKVIESRRR